jgi:hypothetical protein
MRAFVRAIVVPVLAVVLLFVALAFLTPLLLPVFR